MGETERPVELVVRRGGAEKKVSFLPRGKAVEATLWVRDPGVPAARCVRWRAPRRAAAAGRRREDPTSSEA